MRLKDLSKHGPPFSYQIQFGSYYWFGGSGRREGMSDEVAVVFDDDPAAETPVMLKHGPPDKVKAWWDATRKAYQESGNGDFCRYFKMVEGKLDLEELNHCIASSGYRPKFLPR